MTFDSTQLQFKQRAVPNPPVNPTQSAEPGVVTMPDGSQRRVTLEIQVNGVWKKIDPNQMNNGCFLEIAKRCQEIYQTTTQETGQPETLTVYFEQKNLPESWTSASLGRFLPFLKDEVVDLTFQKVEYKTADSDELHVVEEKTHAFDTVKVNQLASSMTWVSKGIFGNREHFLEKSKKIDNRTKRNKATLDETNSEKLSNVKQVLNVQEAGSQGNRCATLSIAAILLKRHNGDLQRAAARFEIPIAPIDGQDPKITLSNGLIELAAATIEISRYFQTDDELFSSVVAALDDAKQPIPDRTNRQAVVQQYAAHIRQAGQMLDVPVFQALEMHGIPFITLVPSQDDLVLGNVSPTIIFDAAEHSLDTYDLTTICFVVRDGLHYQPVIMNDMPNVAQQEKLRSILKNDMEKTLGQIQNLISDTQRTPDEKSVEFNNLVASVVRQYPFDAKPRIVDMLRNGLRAIDDALISTPNDIFIEGASLAFLSRPVPIIEDLEDPIVVDPMEKTLSQIQTLISDTQRTRAAKVDEFKKLVGDIVNSDEGRLKIIRMLPALSTHEEENLLLLPDARFILEATNAFQNPGPVNHGR
jgi:hypothetical protein